MDINTGIGIQIETQADSGTGRYRDSDRGMVFAHGVTAKRWHMFMKPSFMELSLLFYMVNVIGADNMRHSFLQYLYFQSNIELFRWMLLLRTLLGNEWQTRRSISQYYIIA